MYDIAMTEEEKLEFYKNEYIGAPLTKMLSFRCTAILHAWLISKGMEKKREYSAVIRRAEIKSESTKEIFSLLGIAAVIGFAVYQGLKPPCLASANARLLYPDSMKVESWNKNLKSLCSLGRVNMESEVELILYVRMISLQKDESQNSRTSGPDLGQSFFLM